MNNIVVLTPTYNRAKNLPILYESLKKQSNLKFDWLVVDDGSQDETKAFIDNAIKENVINIKYVFQPNGGKERALNTGFSHCVYASAAIVVDSDDYLLPSAIDTVADYLRRYSDNKTVGAFFFHYMTQDGEILKPKGKVIDEDKVMTRYEYNSRHKKHDGCICYLDRVVKKYRYPEFEGEKYVGPTVIQLEMAKEFKIVFSPIVVGVAEYLEGGLSRRGRQLRLKNPNGMLYYVKLNMSSEAKITAQIKYAISIWPYAKLLNMSYADVLKMYGRPILLLATYVPGKLLSFIWERKYGYFTRK